MLKLRYTPRLAGEHLLMARTDQQQIRHHRNAKGLLDPPLFSTDLLLAQPAVHLQRSIALFHQPSGGILERTLFGLLEAGDLCITQQDPFQPFWLARLCFPDTHGCTLNARLTAQSRARTPWGTTFDRCGAEEKSGSPCWLIGPRQ